MTQNTKRPLSEKEYSRILKEAVRAGEEHRRVITFLRWTGCHVSVLAEPEKHRLRVEMEDGKEYICWNRPKKAGVDAHVNVRKAQPIDWDLEPWFKELSHRRRRTSRQYYHALVKDVGQRAGLPDLSPMSFRHTFGVGLLNMGAPQAFVQQKLNCSDQVLKRYLKYSKSAEKDLYERLNW